MKKYFVEALQIISFILKPEVCSSRETFIVKKWTNKDLLRLAYSVQIKQSAISQFWHELLMNYKNLEKNRKISFFKKMRKRSTLSKIYIV